VVEYDPAWPLRFERLRQEYARAMAAAAVPVVAIEHVGSTAVPGLAAKPVIDCDIVVARQDVTAGSQVLAGLGFAPLGELGIPLRWAFREPRAPGRDEHLRRGAGLAVASQPPRHAGHPAGGPGSARAVRRRQAARRCHGREHR